MSIFKRKQPEKFGGRSGVIQLGLSGWQANELKKRNEVTDAYRKSDTFEANLKLGRVEKIKQALKNKYELLKEKMVVSVATAAILIGGSANSIENQPKAQTSPGRKVVPGEVKKVTVGDTFGYEKKQIKDGHIGTIVSDRWGRQLSYDAPTGLWTLVTPQFGIDFTRTNHRQVEFKQPQGVARKFAEDESVGRRVAPEGVDEQLKKLEGEMLMSTLPAFNGWNWPMPASMEAFIADKDNQPLIPEDAIIDSIEITGFATDEGKSPESLGNPDQENQKLGFTRALYGALGPGKDLLNKLGPDIISKIIADNSEVRKELSPEEIQTAAERLGTNAVEAKKVLEKIQLSSHEIFSSQGDVKTLAEFAQSRLGMSSGSDQVLAHSAWREYNNIKLGGEQDPRLNDPAFRADYEKLKDVTEKRGFTILVKYHTNEKQMVRVRVPLVLFLLPLGIWALRRRSKDNPVDNVEPTKVKHSSKKMQKFNPAFADNDQRWYDLESKSGSKENIGDGIDKRLKGIVGLFREVQINPEDSEHTKNQWLVWSEDLWRYFEDPKTKELGADYWQMMQPVISYMKEHGWATADKEKKQEIASKLELYLSAEIIQAWKIVDINKRKEILEAVDKDRELPRKEVFASILEGIEAQGYTEDDLKRAKLSADELYEEYSLYTKARMQRKQDRGLKVSSASSVGKRKYKAWQDAYGKYQEILDELQSPKKSQEGLVDYNHFIRTVSAGYRDFSSVTPEYMEEVVEGLMDEWDRADVTLTGEQKNQRRESEQHRKTAREYAKACILIGIQAHPETVEGLRMGNRQAIRILRDKVRLEEPTIEKDGFDRNNIKHGLDYENQSDQVLFAKYHARALVEVSGNMTILPENLQGDLNNALVIMQHWQQEAFDAYRSEIALDKAIIRERGNVESVPIKLSSEAVRTVYEDMSAEQSVYYGDIAIQLRKELPNIISSEGAGNATRTKAAQVERATALILSKWDEKDLLDRIGQGQEREQVLRDLASRRASEGHMQAAREFGAVIATIAEKLPLGATKDQVTDQLEKVIENSSDINLKDMLIRKQRETISNN